MGYWYVTEQGNYPEKKGTTLSINCMCIGDALHLMMLSGYDWQHHQVVNCSQWDVVLFPQQSHLKLAAVLGNWTILAVAAIQKVLKMIGHLAVQGGPCISGQCAWGHYLVGKSDDGVQQRARQLVSGFYLDNVCPFSWPSMKCELKDSIWGCSQ